MRRVSWWLAVTSAVLAGCGGDAVTEPLYLVIAPEEVQIDEGREMRLVVLTSDPLPWVGWYLIDEAPLWPSEGSYMGTFLRTTTQGVSVDFVAFEPGTARIVANSSSLADTARLTIRAVAADTVWVDPGDAAIAPGEHVDLALSSRDASGHPLYRYDQTWTVSDASLARVEFHRGQGFSESYARITGLAAGVVRVDATLPADGLAASATVAIR